MDHTTIDVGLAQKILKEISKDKMGGWFDLPYTLDMDELARAKKAADKIRSDSKYLVCLGAGGSYLGHRAVIEAVGAKSPTKLVYAGNTLSSKETERILAEIEGQDFSILVTTKSGTTLETAVAFRIFKDRLVKRYGASVAKTRIYVVTGQEGGGTLYDEAVAYDYVKFGMPKGVGGRYSVLSIVGLLPMMVAGVDIDKVLKGARDCREKQLIPGKFQYSAILNYAFSRRFLLEHGIKIEVLASFEPSMMYFHEWWKQLFGESEGKNHGGLFPASVIYTTDLHSLGQYMQDGNRDIVETFIKFASPKDDENALLIPKSNQEEENGSEGLLSFDRMNFVGEKPLYKLNDIALDATLKAHDAGGISTILLELSDDEAGVGLTERSIGYLIYFFEVACAVSAKLNGVNPFDQPGVEAYKKNMMAVLNPVKKKQK